MKRVLPLAMGIVLGALALVAARFLFVDLSDAVHYHANWALLVDGERVDLTADRYMEDVAACSADPDQIRPEDRVHMHDNDHDVVHVHHRGATWGHFLANIGFTLGEGVLITPEGRVLADDGDATLRFVLNGRPRSDVHNEIIRNEDRLLVSYGPASADDVREREFPRVASDAAEFNDKEDPAACLGHGELPFGERVKAAFWK